MTDFTAGRRQHIDANEERKRQRQSRIDLLRDRIKDTALINGELSDILLEIVSLIEEKG